MTVNKTIKRIGRFFFELKQKDEKIIEQSVLIVDNGYSPLGQAKRVIRKMSEYFPNAELAALTLGERKTGLLKDFPSLRYIVPSGGLRPKRYQIAIEMLRMPKRKYDFTVLLSLDITPIIASLFFLKSRNVLLYNRWGQWWSLRLRRAGETGKVTYVNPKTPRGLKGFIKRVGLFFISLQQQYEEIFRYSILLVDDGRLLPEQAAYAMERIRRSFPLAGISILSLPARKQLWEGFPQAEIIQAGNCIIRRYRIARHMLRMRSRKYDYIVLSSLDITPFAASILFMKGKKLLINRWLQLWTIKPRSMNHFIAAIPRILIAAIFESIIFVYLLIKTSWIFLGKSFNAFRAGLVKKGY